MQLDSETVSASGAHSYFPFGCTLPYSSFTENAAVFILQPVSVSVIFPETVTGTINHNQSALRVKSGVKAGGTQLNHNQSALRVKSGLKAGGVGLNHNKSVLRVKSGVKAGAISTNHNQSLLRTGFLV